MRAVAAGAAAGAAGTTALDAVTYLDMALRGRPSSDTPEQTIEAMSKLTKIRVPGAGETRSNRVAGIGPLAGMVTGVGSGVVLALIPRTGWRPGYRAAVGIATGLALLGSNGPMTALGVTDPRTWPASSWISDVIPHLTYGAITAAVLRNLDH